MKNRGHEKVDTCAMVSETQVVPGVPSLKL